MDPNQEHQQIPSNYVPPQQNYQYAQLMYYQTHEQTHPYQQYFVGTPVYKRQKPQDAEQYLRDLKYDVVAYITIAASCAVVLTFVLLVLTNLVETVGEESASVLRGLF